MLGPFLGVQNIAESQYLFFFWGGGGGKGVQKNEYFLGYKDSVDIFVGPRDTGLFLVVISMQVQRSLYKYRFRF